VEFVLISAAATRQLWPVLLLANHKIRNCLQISSCGWRVAEKGHDDMAVMESNQINPTDTSHNYGR
jgi:hypothetical protein